MSTIREIAKLANVSVASVSRALNNDTKYKMTTSTYNRIIDAAKQLDYKLDQSLKTQGKGTIISNIKIGCILSVTKDKYNDPYFMSILSGVESRLLSKGYELSFLKTGPELSDPKNLQITLKEDISGLILMESLNCDTYDIIKNHVPHIVGIDTKRTDIDNIGYDHYDIATLAVEYLIKKGHSNIGFIGGSGNDKDLKNSLRYRGYLSAMHIADLKINNNWVMDCRWDEKLCMELVKNQYKSSTQPTALFVASDLMAMAALSALYEIGKKVPEQVAVIGLSNIELSKYSNPPLTTMEVPTKEIGFAAVDMLLARINGDDLPPRKVTFPTSLVLRSST
jgi:DNA-binding LacI/PurR family transcriptional regulator